MRKQILLSSLFLALCSVSFGKVFTVSNASGNDWWIGAHNNSFKVYLDSAAANPGRDTIQFSVAGGTMITGTADPINITGNDVFINGISTANSLPVIMSLSVTVTGANIDFFGMAFQTTNHSLTLTGSNNSVTNCTFATTGGGQNSVWINGGTGNLVKGSTFTAANLHAISVENGGGHTIDSCIVTGITDVGIIVRGTGNNTIKRCSVSAGSHNGIGMIAGNNTVDSCLSFSNARAGIVVVDGNNNTIRNSVVHSNNTNFWMNGGLPTPDQAGISSTGGNTTIENNFVYGNAANGILVNETSVGANGSTVQNNVIGRDALGNEIGNGWNGVMVWMANGVTTDGNVIVNNGKATAPYSLPDRISGVRYQEVSSGTINANYIGTDASKAVAGNDFDGITLHTNATGVNVTSNIICNNGFGSSYGDGGGIAMRINSNNNFIQSNSIGAHLDGTDGGNNDYGIGIEGCSGNTVGGTTSGEGNVIAYSKHTGNQGCGIWVVLNGATNNTIDNNVIRDNTGDGVLIERGAIGNIVGTSNGGNIITGNENGINVKEFSTNPNSTGPTHSNTLRFNSFACNTNKGIQLTDGGNNLFGFNGGTGAKEVTTVVSDPRPNFVSGKAPAGSTVDIYSTASATLTTCPATCTDDQNQGATFTGASVIADASGNWEYDFVAGVGAAVVNQSTVVVLATETPTTGGTANTSEFSNCGCAAPTQVSLSANDSSLCAGETAALLASANGLGSGTTYSYKWYEGVDIQTGTLVAYQQNDSTLDVTTAGTYFVMIADISDTLGCRDSSIGLPITVNAVPVAAVTAANNPICSGQSTTVNAGATGATPGEVIAWSTGESTNQITVSSQGSYSVTVTNAAGCIASGSVTITENATPAPVLTDVFFCQGDDVTFDAGAGTGYTYLWTPNNETTQTITVSTEATYGVTVTANGCSGSASAFADQSPDPKPLVSLSPNDSICFNKGEFALITATATSNTPVTYAWSNGGSTDSLLSVSDTGIYTVIVSDTYLCTGSDTVEIFNFCTPPTREVPNVFIPGGTDNPIFTPIGTITPSDVLESHMEIYNRWGRKLYETDGFPEWDGTFNGNGASSGVYFWIWNYTDVTNTTYNLNGFVHLLKK